MAVILFIFGILLFISLIVVHEFGHFIAARRNGVEVEEFGIGFPPRAKVLKKHKGTEYTLNWLPLGGFVKLKGEHDSDTEPGSFGAAPLWAKVKIVAAGVLMNFLAAVVLFTILAAVAMPKADLKSLPFYDKDQFMVASDTRIVKQHVFVSVVPGSPAAEAGLQDGDEIVSIGSNQVQDATSVPGITESYAGQTIDITVKRGVDEEVKTVQATLHEERSEDQGFLGIAPVESQVFRSTWSAPIVGFVTTLQYTDVSFRGLGYVVQNLFTGRADVAGDAVGGPVATFKILSDTSSLGIMQVLFVIALISVSLAVMNVLPIPALDGGRLFVTVLFRAIRRPLTKDAEELIHGIGFAFLMGLILVITVVDVRRFF